MRNSGSRIKRKYIWPLLTIVTAFVLLGASYADDKDDYVSMIKRGIARQEASDSKEAARLFKGAISTAPEQPDAYFFLGRLNFLNKDSAAAFETLELFRERVKAPAPGDPEERQYYAKKLQYVSELYFTMGYYDKSKEVLDDILKTDPQDQDAHYNLGVHYYKHERSRPKAYQEFNKAMSINPDSDTGRAAKYAIEFMRNNPDPRIVPDFSFIDQEYSE